MTVQTQIQVVGGKQAINSLRKIDPTLQKEFKAEVNRIAQPAIEAGANSYQQVPLSNMGYRWTNRGRRLFPFDLSKARSGVKARIDTRRNATAFILIEQKDPAAAIFEGAGRATDNRLARSLDQEQGRGWKRAEPGKTRLYGRAVYKARKSIEREMEQVVLQAVRTVQKELG